MPYVTSIERSGIERGIAQERQQACKLLLQQLTVRFGEDTAAEIRPLVEGPMDAEKLNRIALWIVELQDGRELVSRIRALVTE